MIAARSLVAASALWAGAVMAHAELVGSSPADGAKLAGAPPTIELRFNEPVKLLSARLVGSAGAPVTLQAPAAAGQVLRVPLPPALGDGRYSFSFRVTSLDSHPVVGSIAFAIGEAGAVAPPAMEHDALRGWRAAVRAVRDLALLIAAGGALFLVLVGRFPGERTLLAASAVIGAAAALVGVELQGVGFHSSFGLSACVAAGGAFLIATGARPLLPLGALAVVASFCLTGHAVGTRAGSPGQLALAAHVLAAAFWAGSLCALVVAPTSVALRRFSRLGIAAVALLAAAGIVFAVLQLPSLGDLTGSEYGRLIIGKAMLLAALVALACLNRFRFLPRLERGEPSHLRVSIAAELALVVCVVGLTALLVQTPPPRDSVFTLQAAGRVADLSVSHNRLTVRFRDFDPAEVFIAAGNSAAGVEPEPRPMRRDAPGAYSREGSELLFPGTWTIEVQARIGDFERVVFRTEVPIR